MKTENIVEANQTAKREGGQPPTCGLALRTGLRVGFTAGEHGDEPPAGNSPSIKPAKVPKFR